MKLPRRCVTHCDSLSPFLYPSISRREWWVEDWLSLHSESNQIWSLSSSSLFSSPSLCSCRLFFPSRWEAFRVLPLAESLTNVALKCNEVWNGSCGYNYRRTGAVTGMISLSLAIRIGCERGERKREREMERLGDRQRSHRVMSVWRLQTSGAFMEG